jgi:hypothetical protein
MSVQTNLGFKVNVVLVGLIQTVVVSRTRIRQLESGLQAELAIAQAMGNTHAMADREAVLIDVREINVIQKQMTADVNELHDLIVTHADVRQELCGVESVIQSVLADCLAVREEFMASLTTVETHVATLRS